MSFPYWQDQKICNKDGFKIVLSFEEDDRTMIDHFKNDCEWDNDQLKSLKGFKFFSAKVTAYKGVIECGSSYLGACCHKNLKDVLQDGNVENMLGGYMPQMIEEAIEEAIENLNDKQG